MTTADNSPKNKKTVLITFLFLTAALLAVLSAMPAVQSRLRGLLHREDRHVLAKINAFYGAEQQQYLILKIKDGYGLAVEIYRENSESGQQIFLQKFELLNDSDAYITLDKNTTNLALSDADQDGQLDILVPSVDRNGNLRLNTFKFNPNLHMFEPMTEEHSE